MTEYLADAGDVGVDLLIGQELARVVAPGRVPDLRRSAAHQHDGPVPRLLQTAQQHDLDETADVQTIGGGIKADVCRDDVRDSPLVESCGVGLLMDVAA